MKVRLVRSISLFLLLFSVSIVNSQNCPSKYISLAYQGTTFESFSKAAFTPEDEMFVSGAMIDYNEAGHIAKFSKNGIPLWSSYYIIDFYDFILDYYFSKIKFHDFVITEDGGIIVAGQTERYIFLQYALLAKISKYGIVEWTKTYYPAAGFGNLSFNTIYKTSDGDVIAYMTTDRGPSTFFPLYSYNRVIRYSASGQLKWATELFTGTFDAGGNGVEFKRGISQLSNKNIVVGDVVYKSDKTSPVFKINDGRLHFYSLNYATGQVEWESDYPYSLPANDPNFIPAIEFVNELPSGQLAFSTSLYLSTPAEPFLKKKPVTVITNNRGVPQKLISFYSPGQLCELVDVVAGIGPAETNYLFKINGLPVISLVKNEDIVTWTRGYNNMFPPNCFAVSRRGYGIFFSNSNSHQFKLVLTDANGKSDCAETAAGIFSESTLVSPGSTNSVITEEKIYTLGNYKNYFIDYSYPLIKKDEYPLAQTTECEERVECCKDFVDSVNIRQVKLCDGSAYSLPDNNIVKDAGTYPVVYKTAGGCDSISYYSVNVEKNLTALSLGKDTCLSGPGSFELKATAGYDTYNWMGHITPSNTFTVHTPGVYGVKVTNSCGTKSASVTIHEKCDFPIFMPSAFTPNGDNLNDYFGVPLLNKNRLITLKIFNRWGGIVFETNSIGNRWDGKFKNIALTSDVFIYYLVMEGLTGNRITQKGRVLLIK